MYLFKNSPTTENSSGLFLATYGAVDSEKIGKKKKKRKEKNKKKTALG
jgi:hypothetical protein